MVVVSYNLQIPKSQGTMSRVARICYIFFEGDVLKLMKEGFDMCCASLSTHIYASPVKGC
jgi:hypothetical protein